MSTTELAPPIKAINLVPESGEHSVIIGLTGSGKSRLARFLLSRMKQVVVVDPKIEFELPGAIIVTTPKDFIRNKRYPVIYQPNAQFVTSLAAYNTVYEECFKRGKLTVYTDEVAQVGTATLYPLYLRILYTQGRSKGISMMSATQSPTRVPVVMFTQARLWYVFFLTTKREREVIKPSIPGYPDAPSKTPYTFYFYKVGMAECTPTMRLDPPNPVKS